MKLYNGNIAVDDRGTVSFVNDFSFEGVKRYYTVTNHKSHFVRAWHGHKKEAKYITVLRGSAVIGAVEIDDWSSPSPKLVPNQYVLSEYKPAVLYVPAGYANGFMTLTDDTLVAFFSTSSLEDSQGDDFRFDAFLWNIWYVEAR